MLINLDFSQIEVAVLGILSEDEHLLNLIREGRDLYKYFAAVMYDKKEEEITKEERDSLKAPILGISYGRGAKALSRDSGKSEEWSQEFIDRFYEMFPGVKRLHDQWIQEVEKTGQLRLKTGITFKFKKYVWDNRAGKKVESTGYRAKYWQPEIKNYPIQHTAFVVLSTFLATFWREKALHKRDIECNACNILGIPGMFECTRCNGTGIYTKYLLINTVHDSIMLDVRPEYIEEAKKDLEEILAKLPELMYNLYKIRVNIQFKAEIKESHTWYEL